MAPSLLHKVTSSYNSGGQSFLDLLYDGFKAIGVAHGHFRQGLAVKLNTGLGETVHEFAVTQTMLPGSCIDSDNPKTAKLSLARPPVTVCVLAGSYQSLLHGTQHRATPAAITSRAPA